MQNRNIFSFLKPNSPLPNKINTPTKHFLYFTVAKLINEKDAYENAVRLNTVHSTHKDDSLVTLKDKKNLNTVSYPIIFADDVPLNVLQMATHIREDLGYQYNEKICAEIFTECDFDILGLEEMSLTIDAIISDHRVEIKTQALEDSLKENLSVKLLSPGMKLVIPYSDKKEACTVILKVDEIKVNHLKNVKGCIYYLKNNSQINFTINNDNKIDLIPDHLPKPLSLDFKAKGIGGHKNQLAQLLREGFYSRLLPSNFITAYDIKPCKGILLYGPPGTGKTAIARAISHMFSKDKVKIVNGPELKNKFVGQSQENLRNVFYEADMEWILKGKKSDLHVIIFDEIDALCPQRGTRSGSTGVDDDMVSQFLTILDGVESPQNLLVIGMTNRKELLDPALLRPGRLEVHIEIGLPDEEARLEILEIKTKIMRTEKLLDNKVNLNYWAGQTQNFTGAEIEQLIRKAGYYAMGNNFEINNKNELILKSAIKRVDQLQKIMPEHFNRAFNDIKPTFGLDNQLTKMNLQKLIVYPSLDKIITRSDVLFHSLFQNTALNSVSLLISGQSGTGKTLLATYLAELSGIKFVRVISPQKFLGLPLEKQLSAISEEFEKAQQTKESVIILDEIESLMGADVDCQSYSNALRLKYEALLKESIDQPKKCLIIATTKNKNFIAYSQLLHLFNESLEVNPIQLDNANAKETLDLLSKLAFYAGGRFISHNKKTNVEVNISLPIRDLIYKIKQFCIKMSPATTFFADDFFEFVNKDKVITASTSAIAQERFFKP